MGYFEPELFQFLKQLKRNNNREWFNKNKQRYVEDVQQPALEFIADAGVGLRKISPNFIADPRPVGGSMFRIYRDTRFAADKTPYKTQVGVWFAHRSRKDPVAPGYYLHLEPGGVFMGAGMWHPDTKTAFTVRTSIAERSAAWRKAVHAGPFAKTYRLSDERLARAPRGFDAKHELVDDLRLKNFIGIHDFDEKTATSSKFMETFIGTCRDGAPLVKFLCEAIGAKF